MSHTATVSCVPIKDVRALHLMVQELQAQGIKCELIQNAVPRMYYADQIGKHLKGKNNTLIYHTNPEECDFVLRVKDAFYDIGFLRNKDGALEPLFDDFDYPSHIVPSTHDGHGPIREFLGAAFAGQVQHWSGERKDDEQSLHSIGKMLQSYTKHAAVLSAEDEGYSVTSSTLNDKGEVVLELEIA